LLHRACNNIQETSHLDANCKGFKTLHAMEATSYCSRLVLPYQWLEVGVLLLSETHWLHAGKETILLP